VTGPLRHCDRPGCRLCRIGDRDARDALPADSLPTLLVAAGMLFGLFLLACVIVPELVRQSTVVP
jgi:hypothetical protein